MRFSIFDKKGSLEIGPTFVIRPACLIPIRDVKENMIHQTRSSTSIALWSTSDAHMPIVGAFGDGQGSAWAP